MVRKHFVNAVAVVSCLSLCIGTATALGAEIGTAFTYQGSLENGSGPVTDTCDFRFGLWNLAAGGNQVGSSPQIVSPVDVAGGVFTVTLDFGAGAIDGAARWLAIEVKCSDDADFVPLDNPPNPRVALTPAPHAIRAAEGVGPPNALEVDTATSNVGIGTDSPFFPLHVSTASVSGRAVYGVHTAGSGVNYGVYGQSASTDGRGVYGLTTAVTGGTYGGWFQSDSTSGYGVFGMATANSGTNYGGRFRSESTAGYGVYGEAAALSGTTYGVYGRSNSTDGRGVYGLATNGIGITTGVYGASGSFGGRGVFGLATDGTGVTYGGRFESDSTSGRGVFGSANANSGITYGGRFESASADGRGVYGLVTDGTGVTYGGRFQSGSTSGTGVYGEAIAGSGITYGVYGESGSTTGRGVFGHASAGTGITNGGRFESDSTSGRGVVGWATAGSGTNYGVSGNTSSSDGFAGYFTGVSGSKNYFQQNVGIGTTAPDVMLHVVGGSDASLTDGSGSIVVGNVALSNIVMDSDEIQARANAIVAPLRLNPAGGGVVINSSAGFPDIPLIVDGGTDAAINFFAGYVVIGNVNATNIVMDTNEIIARNNDTASELFLNNGSGNVGILRSTTSHPLHVGINNATGNGAHLTAGGAWTNGSSRESKQGFEPIDKQAVLRKVVDLPVTRWQYKGEAVNVHHIGPVAQDFRAAFEVGHDERYITTIDADGVALAAIQGLHQIVQEKDCEIENLTTQVSNLQSQISNIERGSAVGVGKMVEEQQKRIDELSRRLSELEAAKGSAQ